MKSLNIGQDFSRDPSGRYKSDGPGNGEDFRENYLKPKLDSLDDNEKLEVILDDGVEGYGSSFLVEGFAGIVKYGYFTADNLLNKLEFTYKNPDFAFYEKKIIQYVSEAKINSKRPSK